ncbi:ATP-dependent protease ClpP protease subunit [Methylorubrum extorquens]
MASRADSRRPKYAPQMRAGRVRRDPNAPWFRLEAVGDAAAPKATLNIFGYIGQDIDPFTGEKVGVSAETLLGQLRQIPPNADLDVTINSRGGCPFDGCAMHAFLSAHPGKVTVTVAGIAASAASVVALAGDVIRMPANSWLMIHNPSTGAYGTVADMQAAIDELTSIKDGAVAAYVAANRRAMSAEDVGAVMDAETWYTGTQALEAGWIDELMEPGAATMLAEHREVDVPLEVYENVPAELQLADVVEVLPPPAPEAGLVAELRAQVAEMQARLEAAPPAPEPEPEPAHEPGPEDAVEAARLAAEAAAAEQARQAEMRVDTDQRDALRRTAMRNGLTESFDELLGIGATTLQLRDLVIRGAVARAGMVDVSSHAEPVVPPPAKEPAAPALDPDKYYRMRREKSEQIRQGSK